MDVVELAPCMSPTERQLWRLVSGGGDQAAKPGIAVDLEQASEAFQMTSRVLALAVFAENVGGGGITGPAPGAVIGGITCKSMDLI
jgi:hypothetical protein